LSSFTAKAPLGDVVQEIADDVLADAGVARYPTLQFVKVFCRPSHRTVGRLIFWRQLVQLAPHDDRGQYHHGGGVLCRVSVTSVASGAGNSPMVGADINLKEPSYKTGLQHGE
jgi:hypothetical protein